MDKISYLLIQSDEAWAALSFCNARLRQNYTQHP